MAYSMVRVRNLFIANAFNQHANRPQGQEDGKMTIKAINELQLAAGWLASARVTAIEASTTPDEIAAIEANEVQLQLLIDAA